jgi:hypothetical protein
VEAYGADRLDAVLVERTVRLLDRRQQESLANVLWLSGRPRSVREGEIAVARVFRLVPREHELFTKGGGQVDDANAGIRL